MTRCLVYLQQNPINNMDPNFPNPPGAELRQAYEAVARAENLLAEALKLSISGSYLRDAQASGGYWSPEVFRIFGLDRAEEAPPIDVWKSMVLRDDFAHTTEAVQRALRERLEFELEYRICLRDGSVKVLHSHSYLVPAKFVCDFPMVGVVTDITAETQARAAIAAAGEELRRRFPSVDDAELATNLDVGPQILDPDQSAWSATRGGLSHSQVRRVLKLIEEKLPEKVSVKEMAREVGLSESHFSRTFKHITGETPHQFALRLRLERAGAALARSSSADIASVAAECGFFDQSHFTRKFRKKFGITPGEAVRRSTLNRLSTERQISGESKG
jgi:AraC-like DNA-binding protein